jgi:hypothetical protein
MNELTLTEAVKTDLPFPKPNRGRRLALRFAALVVAVSVLGAAHWFTRPPELVWWRSPAIAKTGNHVRVLVPQGWKISGPIHAGWETHGDWGTYYTLAPTDQRSQIVRWILPYNQELASIQINVIQSHREKPRIPELYNGIYRVDPEDGPHRAHQILAFPNTKSWAGVIYERTNFRLFNQTFNQICNSLRIE